MSQAGWHELSPGPTPGWPGLLAPVLSLAITATAAAFFFLYANGLANWPATESLTGGGERQTWAGLGVLSLIVTSMILLAPVLVVLQRWRPPAGAATLLCTIVGVFMAGLDAFAEPWQILAAVAAGLAADVVIAATVARSGDEATRRRAAIGCGVALPMALGASSMVLISVFWELRWPPELWAGSVVMAAFVGLTLALIVFPARSPLA